METTLAASLNSGSADYNLAHLVANLLSYLKSRCNTNQTRERFV